MIKSKSSKCIGRGSKHDNMTHVVTSACVDHKYQDCVAVCPVEAFREADNYLVTDPDECIDCALVSLSALLRPYLRILICRMSSRNGSIENEEEAPDLPIAEGDSPVLA